MIRRFDPDRADMVMSRLRDANPVPKGVDRRTPDQVEEFLLDVMERTDMVQEISKQERLAGGKRRRPTPPWLGFAVGLGLAALVAIPVILVGGESGDLVDDAALEGLPADQASLISSVVGAVNAESLDDFRSHFAEDGRVAFETGILRPYHEGVESGQPIEVSDAGGFEADFLWGAALDRRIRLTDCASESARIFSCEIDFTLQALRIEMREKLSVALDESGGIALLATEPLDIDPADRQQPLGLPGYYEFEAWLQENHPDEYRRLVDPGTPGTINGVEIQFSFAPQNPGLVPEMTALIDEYVASR